MKPNIRQSAAAGLFMSIAVGSAYSASLETNQGELSPAQPIPDVLQTQLAPELSAPSLGYASLLQTGNYAANQLTQPLIIEAEQSQAMVNFPKTVALTLERSSSTCNIPCKPSSTDLDFANQQTETASQPEQTIVINTQWLPVGGESVPSESPTPTQDAPYQKPSRESELASDNLPPQPPITTEGVAGQVQQVLGELGLGSEASSALEIFKRESSFVPDVVSGLGCIGLGQNCPNRFGYYWLSDDCPNWQADIRCQVIRFTEYADGRYGGWSQALAFWDGNGYW